MSYMAQRETLAKALTGHRYDTLSQDSGMQCICGSDSRFQQRDGDLPWTTFEEHLAQVALAALAPMDEKDLDAIHGLLLYIRNKGYQPRHPLDEPPPDGSYDKVGRTAANLDEAIAKLGSRGRHV